MQQQASYVGSLSIPSEPSSFTARSCSMPQYLRAGCNSLDCLPTSDHCILRPTSTDICRFWKGRSAAVPPSQPASQLSWTRRAVRLRTRHAGDAVYSAWSALYPCRVTGFPLFLWVEKGCWWGCVERNAGHCRLGDGQKSAVWRNVYKQKAKLWQRQWQ